MLCFLVYGNAAMLHQLSRNQWVDGAGKLWLPDIRQAEREAGFPFNVLSFFSPYNGDKGGMKIYSFSACGTCTSDCVNQCSALLLPEN